MWLQKKVVLMCLGSVSALIFRIFCLWASLFHAMLSLKLTYCRFERLRMTLCDFDASSQYTQSFWYERDVQMTQGNAIWRHHSHRDKVCALFTWISFELDMFVVWWLIQLFLHAGFAGVNSTEGLVLRYKVKHKLRRGLWCLTSKSFKKFEL